ncbi:hypothetical protein PsorP6_016764 [Peronosclerospora sorghi]|uniref:Uncharacterized protein n=1 Tax=Peronosclerospora sorghi TaxID=230839 RepID=A0ACC0WCH9_9STRA|nr:hypothetical protein PsorP6_016764 [Peronosclerospora sorghi]
MLRHAEKQQKKWKLRSDTLAALLRSHKLVELSVELPQTDIEIESADQTSSESDSFSTPSVYHSSENEELSFEILQHSPLSTTFALPPSPTTLTREVEPISGTATPYGHETTTTSTSHVAMHGACCLHHQHVVRTY